MNYLVLRLLCNALSPVQHHHRRFRGLANAQVWARLVLITLVQEAAAQDCQNAPAYQPINVLLLPRSETHRVSPA